jgi:hypothetical protein
MCQAVELGLTGQVLKPQEVRHLLERTTLRQLSNGITAVPQLARCTVDPGNSGLRGDDVLETLTTGHRHDWLLFLDVTAPAPSALLYYIKPNKA